MSIEQSPARRLPDTTLSDLGPGERALVSAIRLWVRGYPNTSRSLAPMRDRLRRGGVSDEVLLPLVTCLGILSQNARAALQTGGLESDRLGADEAALLAVFAACQRHDSGAAAASLGRWLNPQVRCQCLDSAAQVAAGLSRCSPAVLLRASGAAAGMSALDYFEAAD